MALKRPHAISFSKKNAVRPFEDATSLEFWAHKNDASMFVLGQSTKKRPNGLTITRMFDGKLLDMCELGVDRFVSMYDFKVRFHGTCHRHLKLIVEASVRRLNHNQGTSPCCTSPLSSLTPTHVSFN
jgi:ribosome production factor 2